MSGLTLKIPCTVSTRPALIWLKFRKFILPGPAHRVPLVLTAESPNRQASITAKVLKNQAILYQCLVPCTRSHRRYSSLLRC